MSVADSLEATDGQSALTPTVYLMKIADLRRSSACSGSNCRLFAHITALGGGLPRVLSGLRLGNGTRGELRMLADVRFVSRPVLSAPQNRSASLVFSLG